MNDTILINNLLIKNYQDIELADNEIKFIDKYRNEKLFYQLDSDSQKNILELIEVVDNIKLEKEQKLGIKKDRVYVKKLGEWPGYQKMIRNGVW